MWLQIPSLPIFGFINLSELYFWNGINSICPVSQCCSQNWVKYYIEKHDLESTKDCIWTLSNLEEFLLTVSNPYSENNVLCYRFQTLCIAVAKWIL